jgi:flagellar hook assembly protein FlgD
MGREVRKIDLGERPPGLVRVQWDGRTNDGVDAAPGIYFVRVQLGARELGGRIIRLH